MITTFELVWQPEIGREPTAAVFTENVDGETYAMVVLTPPQTVSTLRLPRETIFIIDTSGSMEGESMEQARDALALALDQLQPADYFNVIEFDSDTQMLFPSARPADRASVTQAQDWVESGSRLHRVLEPTRSARQESSMKRIPGCWPSRSAEAS